MTTCCYFYDFKEWVCWRGREKIAYWCMHFYHVFSLFLSLFLFLSLYYFSLSSFCFLALGYFSFQSMATALIYNGLILWDFSLLPIGLYQLFLVYGGHLFRAADQPIGCSSTTTTRHAQCTLFLPLPIPKQNSICLILL